MKLIAAFLSLTIAVLQLSSCQKTAPFDPAVARSFFPLHPGLTWTYRVVDKSQKTAEIFTDHAMESQEREGSVKALSGVISEYSGSDSERALTILYMVEDGYVTRLLGAGDRTQFLSLERGFLPLLLKPDLTWSNSLSPVGRFLDGFRITQTHWTSLEARVVQVPAGHYSDCIRIETEAVYKNDSSKEAGTRQLRYVDWYAPNVGLIKTVVLENGFLGTEVGRVELLSFADSRS